VPCRGSHPGPLEFPIDHLVAKLLREEAAGEGAPGALAIGEERVERRLHARKPAGARSQLRKPTGELAPPPVVDQLVRERRDGPAVRYEGDHRIAGRGKEEERAPPRGVELPLVDRQVTPGEPGERRLRILDLPRDEAALE
jgi:hypothetical protein